MWTFQCLSRVYCSCVRKQFVTELEKALSECPVLTEKQVLCLRAVQLGHCGAVAGSLLVGMVSG